jgi:hypothetical protein
LAGPGRPGAVEEALDRIERLDRQREAAFADA